jgi:hypothetical protein
MRRFVLLLVLVVAADAFFESAIHQLAGNELRNSVAEYFQRWVYLQLRLGAGIPQRRPEKRID